MKWNELIQGNKWCKASGSIQAAPTTSFQLPYIVAWEPPSLAIERAFPPAPLLLSDHTDDVTLGERQFVLIGLLEGKASLDQQLATPTALWHVLGKKRAWKTEAVHIVLLGYLKKDQYSNSQRGASSVQELDSILYVCLQPVFVLCFYLWVMLLPLPWLLTKLRDWGCNSFGERLWVFRQSKDLILNVEEWGTHTLSPETPTTAHIQRFN